MRQRFCARPWTRFPSRDLARVPIRPDQPCLFGRIRPPYRDTLAVGYGGMSGYDGTSVTAVPAATASAAAGGGKESASRSAHSKPLAHVVRRAGWPNGPFCISTGRLPSTRGILAAWPPPHPHASGSPRPSPLLLHSPIIRLSRMINESAEHTLKPTLKPTLKRHTPSA
jgi:hypothetical protein